MENHFGGVMVSVLVLSAVDHNNSYMSIFNNKTKLASTQIKMDKYHSLKNR
jgi:hypothetical protein